MDPNQGTEITEVTEVTEITDITQKLKALLSKYDIDYIPLAPSDQQIVYDIFLGKTLDINKAKKYSGDVLNYMGMYLKNVKNDTAEAMEYYRLSIDKGNVDAISNYAVLLKSTGNISEAKKYYLIAIDKGNVMALNNYACIIEREENDTEAKKYYLMAIDKGYVLAMYNYGWCLVREGNIPEAKKYYLMAIDKGYALAMYNYGFLCENEGNIPEAKKYYLMGVKKEDFGAFNKLQNIYKSEYCEDNSADIDEEFYEFLKIAYNNQKFKEKLCPMFRHLAEIYTTGLEYIDLHIQYSPDSSGAKQAKKDFTDRLVNLKDHTKDHQKDHK